MRLYAALASAIAVAYALAYIAHSDWGLSQIKIREDALAAVGLLVVAVTVKVAFQGKKNRES